MSAPLREEILKKTQTLLTAAADQIDAVPMLDAV
jgi:hypothetical protein